MADAPVKLTLEIAFPGRPSQTRVFEAERIILGRESGDVVLRDPETSALHAEIDCTQGHVIVRDLGSSNGTWRDEKRLPQFALFVGQKFRCGATTITLVAAEGTAGEPRAGKTFVRGDAPPSSSTLPGALPMGAQGPSGTVLPGAPAAPATATLPGPFGAAESAGGAPFAVASIPATIPTTMPGDEAPVRSGSTAVAPVVVAPPDDPPPGNTAVAPRDHDLAPLARVEAAAGAPHRVARDPTPVPLRPVANAVIKPGDRGRAAAQTGPFAPLPPRRGRWKRLLAIGAIAAVVVGVLSGLSVLVWRLIAGRDLAFAAALAERLPRDAVGFAALKSPEQVLAMSELPDEVRTNLRESIGFEITTAEGWREAGLDPAEPAGLALLDGPSVTFALVIGMVDAERASTSASVSVAKLAGVQEAKWSERTFGDVAAQWLEQPIPVATWIHDGQLVVVWSARGDAAATAREAESLAKVTRGERLADTDAFGEIVPPPGDAVALMYVDGAGMRGALPAGGEGLAMKMALADIDGLALALSRDGERAHLVAQAVLREGSSALSSIGEAKRDRKALDRIVGPVLAAAHGATDGDSLRRAFDGVGALGAAFVVGEMQRDWGIDLRSDVLGNLGGEFGCVLQRLPSKPEADDMAVIGFASVVDEGKAKELLERLLPKLQSVFGASREDLAGTTVVRFAGARLAVLVAAGHVWVTFGQAEARDLVEGTKRGFLEEPRHAAIRKVMTGTAPAVAFADLRELLAAGSALLDSDARTRMGRFTELTNPLEVATLEATQRGRTGLLTLTVHTSSDDALALLLGKSTKLVFGELLAEQRARARAISCQEMQINVARVTAHEWAVSGKPTEALLALEREANDRCNRSDTSDAWIRCVTAAQTLAELERCETTAAAAVDPTQQPEPLAVPYVDDIWPNTRADGTGEGRPRADVNYGVDLGTDPPSRGPADALVTIVEFGDFQCPHCKRAAAELDAVLAEHGAHTRVVFRHNPLEMHPQARMAAKAALAAARQEKFWEMHDRLFDRQFELSEENMRKWAGELGLDAAKFDRDFYDADLDKRIDADLATAKRFGVKNTPSFFVNGRFLEGAQPAAVIAAIVAEEKGRAERFVERRGATRKGLYEDMISRFAPEVVAPPPPELPSDDGKRYLIDASALPKRGSTGFARVTIVECGDFDCPYCARARKTIERLLAEYPTQIAFHFAHMPLPFHADAEPAARAAVAADRQGKFWEMHDVLFRDTTKRTETDFVAFAREIGLDVDKFKSDFSAQDVKDLVTTQAQKVCKDNDATATPTFYVNGRRVEGAVPYESFKALIDTQLAGGI